ncbi:MAG: hypothetical protein IPM21_02800 [Acidobacteria bacterium]|nr:hypothetical protein [Acidobacteriota bacterium]
MRLVFALILLIFVCCLVGCSGVAYRLPGSNMAPTITPDDMAVVNPVHYTFNDVERFDIVVFAGGDQVDFTRAWYASDDACYWPSG